MGDLNLKWEIEAILADLDSGETASVSDALDELLDLLSEDWAKESIVKLRSAHHCWSIRRNLAAVRTLAVGWYGDPRHSWYAEEVLTALGAPLPGPESIEVST
jgi:hypothetical protein